MALDTYTNLRAAIADYMARSDLTGAIVDAIAIVEAIGNRGGFMPGAGQVPALRTSGNEGRDTATLAAASSTPGRIALPTDYLAIRSIKISSTTPIVELDYLTPQQLDDRYVMGATGRPVAFTIDAGEIRFSHAPDLDYTLSLGYWRVIPPLATNASNWLLTAAPQVYLHGAAAWLYGGYVKNPQAGAWDGQMFAGAITALNGADQQARYGGQLSIRPLTVA